MSMLILLSFILSTAQQIEFYDHLKNITVASEYWKIYKSHYNLKFYEIEDSDRKWIFLTNLLQIEAQNRKNGGFKMEMNEFGHLTVDEFKKKSLSPKNKTKSMAASNKTTVVKSITPVDWRTKNVVNSIRDQRPCLKSNAFSAVSAVESAIAIKTGKLLQLSVQDVIDCSSKTGNGGCDSGDVESAFDYIIKRGITSEERYIFNGWDEDCYHSSFPVVANISSYVKIESGDENSLSEAVSKIGPVSATVVSSTYSFRFYKSGIYYEPKCNGMNVDHAVVVVGVTDEYYIVRNSWGYYWGNGGYIYMARNRDNNCEIATYAIYPIV